MLPGGTSAKGSYKFDQKPHSSNDITSRISNEVINELMHSDLQDLACQVSNIALSDMRIKIGSYSGKGLVDIPPDVFTRPRTAIVIDTCMCCMANMMMI